MILINLDNLTELKANFPRNEYGITLKTNIIPIGLENEKEPQKIEMKDRKVAYSTNKTKKILFDLQHPTHTFKFQNRTFVVTLLEINKKAIDNVPMAIEYKFGISEK